VETGRTKTLMGSQAYNYSSTSYLVQHGTDNNY